MAFRRVGQAYKGDVKFTCPACNAEFTKAPVTLPIKDPVAQGMEGAIVTIPSATNPEGVDLLVELEKHCEGCGHTVKQFFRVE
jgi:hypothetical protein